MAIGSFANLAPAQLELAQRRAASGDLLSNALQGLQQGIQLQKLPQQLQDQALARQLQNAVLGQRLQDLQNPQAALLRKLTEELTLKGALNPDLGIRASEPGLVGQTIGTPSAIGQTESELNSLIAASPQMAIPTAAAGSPETPISIFGLQTGLTSNPNIPRQAKENETNDKIRVANARLKTAGVTGQFIPDGLGGMIFAEKPTTSGGVINTTQVLTPDKTAPIKVPPKGGKSAEGLTANQQSNLRLRGGRSLVDISQYTDPETGVVDWNLYATKVGEAEGNTLHSNNLIKNARNATKTTLDEKNLQIYGNRMAQANDDFDKLTQTGFDPTSIGPQGLLGGWLPNLLKPAERQLYEQSERNFINSVLRRESGAVITDDEFSNARRQYFPQPGDAESVLTQKAANRKLVVDEFKRLGGQATSDGGPAQGGPASPVTSIQRNKGESTADYLKRKYNR